MYGPNDILGSSGTVDRGNSGCLGMALLLIIAGVSLTAVVVGGAVLLLA